MTTPAVQKPNNLRLSSSERTPEAARERMLNRKRYAAASRKVMELGREKLIALANGLQDVPTDMPHSDDVKHAYEAAFDHMRRQEWPEAREHLLALGISAFGWVARIDVAETREALDAGQPAPPAAPEVRPATNAPRTCVTCGAEFHLAGPGRPPKRCPECRA